GQPAVVHAMAAAINATLGSRAVAYSKPVLSDVQAGPAALAPLVEEIRAGQVDTLLVTAYNPGYTAPDDLDFAGLAKKVPNLIYRGLFDDETTRCSTWFVPATHELEQWGDTRAADGTIGFQQPLINPLWNGLTTAEVLACFVGKGGRGSRQLLRESWQERHRGP